MQPLPNDTTIMKIKIARRPFLVAIIAVLLFFGNTAYAQCSMKNIEKCRNQTVCSLATSKINGKIIWQGNKSFIREAQKRGLQCGTISQVTKRAPKPQKSFLHLEFLQLNLPERKYLQTKLKGLGLYTSEIDGLYGPKTDIALKKYASRLSDHIDFSDERDIIILYQSILQRSEPVSETRRIQISSGTVFSVSAIGHLATNHHVIDKCVSQTINVNGQNIELQIIATDEYNDLALLKGEFRPKSFMSLNQTGPTLLQDVYVAGFPFGLDLSSNIKITKGIVSATSGIGNNISNFQIDAALQPGNSGGPVVDGNGNVLGIAVAKLDTRLVFERYGTIPENTNFSIKSNILHLLMESQGIHSAVMNRSPLSTEELGDLLQSSTFLLSCWN